MTAHNIIVIGGSAGGIEPLRDLVAGLPDDLQAALFVVIHFPPASISYLSEILNRKASLPTSPAKDGETIQHGHIYVSVPDYHLILDDAHIRLTRDARENHTRPSIDVLFRTAAQSYGPNVVGVVLSGLLNDGTSGLIEIKQYGGIAIVQDPATAPFGDMPLSAISHVPEVDYVLSPPEIAAKLVDLSRGVGTRPAAALSRKGRDIEMKRDGIPARVMPSDEIVHQDTAAQQSGNRNGEPSIYSCPDCGGVLWEMDENGFVRFRCHVGHSFSGEVLLEQQNEVLESSIWYALRTMIDKGRLARQLEATASARGHTASASHFQAQAEAAEYHSGIIRQLIESTGEKQIAGRVVKSGK